MWRILQNVIIPGLFSTHDLLRLLSNVYHGIAKPVKVGHQPTAISQTLGGLTYQSLLKIRIL